MDAAMLVNGVLVEEGWCDHVVASALIERSHTNAGTEEGTENNDKSKNEEKDGTKSKGGDEDIQHKLHCFVYQQPPHGL